MKKFNLSMLAMAGLLFASCAEKEVVEDGGQGEARSEGYMALSINLPTTPSTRAANDDFDDGDEDEYAVTNCALLLFEGATEEDATLFKAQSVTLPEGLEGKDNITTSYQVTAQVNGRTKSGGKLYALALLNYDKVLTAFSADGLPTFAQQGNNSLTKEATLSDIREMILDKTIDLTGSKKSFFMTNAVLSTAKGGTVSTPPSEDKVFQLAELDPAKVFETLDEAKENPAGEILVERAVAKATLGVAQETASARAGGFDPAIGNTGLTVSKIEWVIDNMQPETYIFRNPGTCEYIGYKNVMSNNYRFVGGASTLNQNILGTDIDYYRTYWCIDPMYKYDAPIVDGKDVTSNYMLSYSDASFDFKQIYPSEDADITPFYCYENTFDVEHQRYRNTTRAILRVTFTDAQNRTEYYTVNGGGITSKENAEREVLAYVIAKEEVQSAVKSGVTGGKDYEIKDNTFNIEYEDKGGQHKVKSLTIKDDVLTENSGIFISEAKTKINDALATLVGQINNSIVVFKYSNNVMYYEARFQHFAGDGDADLAPWNVGESTTDIGGGSTASAYPGNNAEQNYLGRYGMVRNNWYDVEITAINGLGYPEIPSVTVKNPGYDDPDTPDDNLKENIAVKIHVLSWALRKQGWSF